MYGASEGRDPGPLFSTRAYFETYPDVADAGVNPLVHYLLYGRNEGRQIVPSPLVIGEKATIGVVKTKSEPRSELTSAPPPLSFPLSPPSEKLWVRHRDLQLRGKTGLKFRDVLLGTASNNDGRVFAQAAGAVEIFCRLMSKDVKQELRYHVGENLKELDNKCESSASSFLCFEHNYLPLVDVWFTNDHTLRIRFSETGAENGEFGVVRLFQNDISCEASPVLIVESPLKS